MGVAYTLLTMSFLSRKVVPLLLKLLPHRSALLRYIGWYCTRLLVVSVWIGVLWVILGRDLLPRSSVKEYNCINVSESINYTDDSLSYSLPCNSTTSVECIATIGINESCISRLTFTLSDDNRSTQTGIIDLYQTISSNDENTASLLNIPEGHFFSLMILVLCSSFGGFVAKLVKLPPLLGMMVAGFILENTSSIIDWISPVWSSVLRNIALTIILIRGGLALDAKKLWKLKFVLPLLAVLPCLFEGGMDSIISIFYIDLPWQWGLALGYLLSAISPAVVVPTTLVLRDTVKGINEGIATLIVAAANVDVVIAISLFSIFLGLIFSEGNIVLDVFRAPIELTVGILYGIISGLLLWVLPTRHHTETSMGRNRFFLLFGFGLLSLFGGRRALIGGASLAGAGALGTVVVSFVSVQKYSIEDKKTLSRYFYIIWQFAQPVLFGLIGAALNINTISGDLIGKAVLVILCGLIVRVTVAVLAVTGQKFTIKEKIFIGFSWLPKATVQAALGSIPLDLARESGNSQFIEYGETILTIAVLAIVITAPVGAILTGVFGPYLLKHPDEESNESLHSNPELPVPISVSNNNDNDVQNGVTNDEEIQCINGKETTV